MKIPKGGNQNPYDEEEQTTQLLKEKHTHKSKDQVTQTPLKIRVNSGAPEGWAVPAPLLTPIMLI